MQLKIFDLQEQISLMRSELKEDRCLNDIISYFLYREYYTDFGVYTLSSDLLRIYCRHHRNLLSLLYPIGKDIVRSSTHHGVLEIIDTDLWVILSNKEVLLNGPQIQNYKHRRMVASDDGTRKKLLKRAIVELARLHHL